jgi:hypothetical protein
LLEKKVERNESEVARSTSFSSCAPSHLSCSYCLDKEQLLSGIYRTLEGIGRGESEILDPDRRGEGK